MLADILGGVGNVLDTPGSMLRDALVARNPFDQLTAPWSADNRTTGRDVLRRYGLIGQDDNWGNFAGGLAAELALDPINIIGGIGMLRTAAKLSKPLNVLRKSGYFTPDASLAHAVVRPYMTKEAKEFVEQIPMLPRKHKMLKASVKDASKAARQVTRNEFRFGRPNYTPLEVPPGPKSVQDALTPAWDEMSARYPQTASSITGVGELPTEMVAGPLRSGAGYNMTHKTMLGPPNDSISVPDMLHEFVHAAQSDLGTRYPKLADKLGVAFDPNSASLADILRLEAPAYRRETEAILAGQLYDMLGYARRGKKQASTLAGYNLAKRLQPVQQEKF